MTEVEGRGQNPVAAALEGKEMWGRQAVAVERTRSVVAGRTAVA